MTPDKATVEAVAKAICAAQEGGSYCSDKCADCVPDAVDGGEIMVLAQAALAALPTPTDASGLVEALEEVMSELDKRLDEAAQMGVTNLCLSEVKDIARQALAQHRAGNPWSDVVPTEPGDYYVSFTPWHKELAMIEVNAFYGYPAGTLLVHTMREGSPSPLSELQGTAKWCKVCGPLTPPEGS